MFGKYIESEVKMYAKEKEVVGGGGLGSEMGRNTSRDISEKLSLQHTALSQRVARS